MSPQKPSPLRKLVDILSSAVQAIDNRYAAVNIDFPALDEPCDPTSEAEQLLTTDPGVAKAVTHIVAAAGQLSASVEFPALAVVNTALSFHVAASLRVASSTNVVEILREAGSTGLHVAGIAKKNGSHPTKTARVLRLLATHHIFREISPDVFTNNRISSMIDSRKSSNDLLAKPHDRHSNTSGLAAFVEHSTDVAFKAAAYLIDSFTDLKFSLSEELTETSFNIALETDLSVFAWLEKPENRFRRDTFGVAMDGTRKLEVPEAILKGFDWNSLSPGEVVVDVGGGIGSTSLTVLKKHPDLNVILQDFPGVMDQAREYWKAELPNAVSSGAIVFQGHNFFEPQPVKRASVFLLRGVIHDWNDNQAFNILRCLRDAATPKTQLLIVDQVLRYACTDMTQANTIPGAAAPSPPAPLLVNYGKASRLTYLLDLQMLNLFNSRERTLAEFASLTSSAGWKIVRVFHIPGSPLSHIVSKPIE